MESTVIPAWKLSQKPHLLSTASPKDNWVIPDSCDCISLDVVVILSGDGGMRVAERHILND
ncbi:MULTISPECIES: hypothetical protein [unclassified Calothrix]|uniref:hypothetical protein n=1 Tax=unclassified Calothrix TaxID=2619626 RepID=UPI001685FD5C|nr:MULTISPECIES: hypothetical protein [unclassified Calothrix]